MPDVDDRTKSTQVQAGTQAQEKSAPTWRPASLWLWPALAITLAGLAGAQFGAVGALLVGGEALAAIVVSAGVLTLSRDRWLAISMAAALIGSLVVFVGLAWLRGPAHKGSLPVATATPSASASQPAGKLPVNWQGRAVSQAMAHQANFRGADLEGANLAGLRLAHQNFDGVLASGASVRGSQLDERQLPRRQLAGCVPGRCDPDGCRPHRCRPHRCRFRRRKGLAAGHEGCLVWPGRHTKPSATCR